MRLQVTTPTRIAVDVSDVVSVRARDETGSFGIWPGHDDLVAALVTSVLAYRTGDGREHFVAVQGGALLVRGGETVELATRDAVAGDDLVLLESTVLERMRHAEQSEGEARSAARRLQVAALRQLARGTRARPIRIVEGREVDRSVRDG